MSLPFVLYSFVVLFRVEQNAIFDIEILLYLEDLCHELGLLIIQ